MSFKEYNLSMKRKILIIVTAVLLVLGAAVGAVLILRSRGVKIPLLSPPAEEEAATEGLGSAALDKSKNPLKNEVPGNPFEGETNPFEGGTNAIEKSYSNPLK